MLPKALEPLRGDRALRRQIGLWLRENGVKHPIIITREPRIAFYAQGKAIPLEDYSYPRIIQLARETGANYLIINTKDLGTGLTEFLQAINPEELVLIPGKMQARQEEGGDKWLIYQFKEPD
jgi:DNA-binding transcriptional MocR family regulator